MFMGESNMENIRNGKYYCPYCGAYVMDVECDSVMYNIPVRCPKCELVSYPAIYEGRELDIDEPFLTDQL